MGATSGSALVASKKAIRAAESVQEGTLSLIVRYVQENNLPYITWDEIEGAASYKVIIDRDSRRYPTTERMNDLKIAVFPGEKARYQVIPLDAQGSPMENYVSEPLEVSYTIKEGFGGVEEWERPDGYASHRGKKEFPEGTYWSPALAEEVKDWMLKTYGTQYLLWGHIAEINPETGLWMAPISPQRRLEPDEEGKGLDCVGFVNGFYYLYTLAFAGEDYTRMDRVMDETHGVYGSPYTPLGALGFSSHIVIKPTLGGNYADASHIRPGDINESDDHAWIVSHIGQGEESRIWEYEYLHGFYSQRTLSGIKDEETEKPYDYWISGIANPLESYSKIRIFALDEKDRALEGGSYALVDRYQRTLALEDKGEWVELYRPDGEEFFYLLFVKGYGSRFYDADASFHLEKGETTLHRVIGGRYILEELSTPEGYEPLAPIPVDLEPGEEKIIFLRYKKK